MNPSNQADQFSNLRQQAETIWQRSPTAPSKISVDMFLQLLHELEVHQIELEIQNEHLRAAQVELEKSRRRYIDLYDFAPVGYFTLDTAGMIQEVNLTGAVLLGVEREVLTQQALSHFVFPEDQDIFYFFIKDLLESRLPHACELRMVKKDGSFFYIHLEGTAEHIEGNVSQCRMAVSDITEHRKVEQQALELAAERNRVEVLEQFVSNASHDLRTPLAIICSQVYLLKKAPSFPEQQPQLDLLEKSVKYLMRLVNNMLNLSTLDLKTEFRLAEVELNELVRAVVLEHQPLADKKQQDLIFDPQIDLLLIPSGDAFQLKCALTNVIINALNFTPLEGRIIIRTYRQGTFAVLEVRDTGIGISPEDLPRIFDRFYRADKARRTEYGGSGLGLAIVKKIVEFHRGHLEVESEPGYGSTFKILLPMNHSE